MKPNKPAKLITKLLDQTKLDAKRIADLEKQLTSTTERHNHELAVALQADRLINNSELARQQAEHAAAIRTANARIDHWETAYVTEQRTVEVLRKDNLRLGEALASERKERNDIKTRLDELEPRFT